MREKGKSDARTYGETLSDIDPIAEHSLELLDNDELLTLIDRNADLNGGNVVYDDKPSVLTRAKAVLRERYIRSSLESLSEEALTRISDDAAEDPVRRQVAASWGEEGRIKKRKGLL